jgi:hypothetical protein
MAGIDNPQWTTGHLGSILDSNLRRSGRGLCAGLPQALD